MAGEIVGVDYKAQLNSSLIALSTSASLNISPDLREIIVKSNASSSPTDWKGRLAGKQEWSVDHEGLLQNSSNDGATIAQDASASAKLKVDTGSGPTLTVLPSLDSVDITLSQELAEIGALDEPLWRFIRPAERELTFDVSGTLIEPTTSAGAVYDELITKRQNGTILDFELNVLGVTFAGACAIGDVTRDAETGGEEATIDMSFESDLDVTKTGSFGDGFDTAFSAFMNKNSVNAAMVHYDGSSAKAGTKKLSGSGYYSELSISIEDGEEVTASGTLEGDGALSVGTV
jgi:hypothetical protein